MQCFIQLKSQLLCKIKLLITETVSCTDQMLLDMLVELVKYKNEHLFFTKYCFLVSTLFEYSKNPRNRNHCSKTGCLVSYEKDINLETS